MSTQTLPSQLGFLADAAQLLRTTAPETSAHLASRRNALLADSDVPLPALQRQHVCSACGYVLVPGREGTLAIEADKALRGKKSRPGPRGGGQATRPDRAGIAKVFTCGSCGAYTKIALPPPGPIVRRKKAAPGAAAAPAPVGTSAPRPSANASSKKRAKSRKAGLQALLSQSRAPGAGGLGLSLADFMKK